MAKNTQEAEVIVTLNGQAAKRAVAELTQEYSRLQKEALAAYKAGDAALGKELDTKAAKLQKDIEITRRETKKFADVMKNINGASLKELRGAAKQLQSEINKLTPGTQEFITKSKQLQQVNTRINQLRGSFKGLVEEQNRSKFSIQGLADGFNKYFGMVTAGIAAVTGLSMAFRKAAQDAAAMDDAYAQVRKTTGLTAEQVKELNEAFKKMDTRTSREELNRMAYEAGKLGFTGVENIRQFVEAADIINVALGDVLGEGATLEIAKLAQVFAQSTAALDKMDLKGKMLAVGSAVNQLGKESTASESYMVDFLGRLGGVATQAGLSADQILGYASALDQMKQKVEMSATAFQKLIQQMIKKPQEFVEAAGMPLEEFKNLMENDMNAAIKKVLEGFNDMGGLTQLVPVFKDMGLDGARAASVIASLAANLDKVSAAQATANEHLQLGTSMTREYEIMNSSMQARLEKARKEFKDASIALGESLNPIMLKSTKITTYLIKGLASYGKEIKAALISIAALTAVIKAHNIVHAIYNGLVKASSVLAATWKTITAAVQVAFYKLTGATEAAAAAQAQLNAVMSASVFGVIALAVAGLTAAIVNYAKRQKEANDVAKMMEEIQSRISSEYAETAGKVEALTDIVHNNNLQLDQRQAALEELRRIVPAYHADLTREGKLINDNTDALVEYLKNLEKVTRAKILEEEYTKATTDVIEAERKKAEAESRKLQALVDANGDATEMTRVMMQSSAGAYSVSEITPYGHAVRDVKTATEELTKAQEIQGEIRKQIEKESGEAFKARQGELSEEQKEIEEVQRKYEILFAEAKNAYIGIPAEGMKTMGKLQEELNKEIAEIRKKYAAKAAEDTGGGGSGGSNTVDSKLKKEYDKKVKILEQHQREEENILKQSLANREITQAEYNARMNVLTMQGLQDQINLARQYGQDTTKYTSKLLDEEIKLIGDGMEKINETVGNVKPPTDIVDPRANEAFWEEIYKKRDEIVASLQDASLKEEFDNEMQWLEKLHEKQLLAEEDFEKAKIQTKLKYAQQAAEKLGSITEKASGLVQAIQDAELANAEAAYQKELSAAGDNAEERERIEANYENKKLEIQKRYADVDMGINIAKAIAAGALAAIQAFAQLGPIAGAVAAGLIAATTAAEVATIIAQRNAIKNSSVNSPASSSGSGSGSSGSSQETGTRMITGYSEGGNTMHDASDSTPVGIVHANEWVAPAWMVRENPVVFKNLEEYRKSGSRGHMGKAVSGFADGGFTGNDGKAGQGIPANAISRKELEKVIFDSICAAMDGKYIHAVVVRNDIDELNDQDKRFKAMTSRGSVTAKG